MVPAIRYGGETVCNCPSAGLRPSTLSPLEFEEPAIPTSETKALLFDVFGTVVDWRSSISREGEKFGREKGIQADWTAFADKWRGKYQPAMQRVRSGERAWVKLDDLHRESLEELLEEFGIAGLSDADKDHLNKAWHRLDPWPASVSGLTRLKRTVIIGTLFHGNVALRVQIGRANV